MTNYHPVGTVYFSSYWRTIDVTLSHNDDGTVSELTIGNLLSASPQHTNVRRHYTSLDKKDCIICTIFWASEEIKLSWIDRQIHLNRSRIALGDKREISKNQTDKISNPINPHKTT